MSAAEVAAVVARLTAAKLRVFDAAPDAATYPYVIVYADAGVGSSDRECASINRREIGWQTTVIGVSAAQARAAVDRVTGALEGWRPVVAGRSCSRVEHSSSQPVRPDEQLPTSSLFIATDQWRFVSEPA